MKKVGGTVPFRKEREYQNVHLAVSLIVARLPAYCGHRALAVDKTAPERTGPTHNHRHTLPAQSALPIQRETKKFLNYIQKSEKILPIIEPVVVQKGIETILVFLPKQTTKIRFFFYFYSVTNRLNWNIKHAKF